MILGTDMAECAQKLTAHLKVELGFVVGFEEFSRLLGKALASLASLVSRCCQGIQLTVIRHYIVLDESCEPRSPVAIL